MKKKLQNRLSGASPGKENYALFLQRALALCGSAGILFITLSFYIRTYYTATVKISFFYIACAVMLALWATFKTVTKEPFKKENILPLLPLFCWSVWLVISFVFNPYKAASAQDFSMVFLTSLIPVFLATSLKKEHIFIINKTFIIAAAAGFTYGIIQTVDLLFLNGLDIMPWRGFFGKRVFSTSGNPNFFGGFVMLSSFIIFANWLRSFEKKYLLIFAMGLVNLYMSESKGAWVGFSAGCVIFGLIYALYNGQEFFRKNKKLVAGAVALFIICAALLVSFFAYKRMQSVNFRIVTWQGVLKMAAAAPVKGHGTGSFATVYPKFRKPEAFYIEGVHNIETTHAENEFLEVLATNGVVGLALFLWVIFFVLFSARKKFKELLKESSSRAPPQFYFLLGFVTAFCAVLIHNFFDISMRFSGTMFLFAVAQGAVLVLSGFETEAQEKETAKISPLAVIFQALAFIIITCGAGYSISVVAEPLGGVAQNPGLSRMLLMVFGWGALFICTGLILYLYIKVLKGAKTFWPAVFIIISVLPMCFAARVFRADYYRNVANAYGDRGDWATALQYYVKSAKDNPFEISVKSFCASMAANRWEQFKSYNPKEGDINNISKDDFERADDFFAFVYELSPYNTMLQHRWGELYYKKGMDVYNTGSRAHGKEAEILHQKALEYFGTAKTHFEEAIKQNPVNHRTYLYLASMEHMKNDHAAALVWLEKYTAGPVGVTNPDYLKKHTENAEINDYIVKMRQYGVAGTNSIKK
ncbi:O-antigen ligase [Elusimicrobium posterum]|uniref:O-antigen ligase family protein n=1 Tax=Elusimicrobium posterum TaxID=3116653 RepID=UPI003C7883E0